MGAHAAFCGAIFLRDRLVRLGQESSLPGDQQEAEEDGKQILHVGNVFYSGGASMGDFAASHVIPAYPARPIFRVPRKLRTLKRAEPRAPMRSATTEAHCAYEQTNSLRVSQIWPGY